MTSIFEFLKIGDDIDGEAAYDRSGYSVSLSNNGEILAIGAFENNNSAGPNSGHVRVYRNVNNIWNQIGDDINGEAPNNYSGWSVSLSSNGDIVAIGSIKKDCDADSINDNRGQVRVYKNINDTWSKVGDNIIGESTSDYSGYSVSLSNNGDVVAIGAIGNDNVNNIDSGHVRVYRDISGTWTQIGDDINGEASGDKSGQSVSISSNGDIVAIGAYQNDNNGSNSGHVRIYRNIDGSWTQVGSDIDGEAPGDKSGYSVTITSNGDVVAIGAPYNNNANGTYSGQVRVYKNINGSWNQIGDDINGEANDNYSGESVSLSSDGSILAIGASRNNDNYPDSGHVRVYRNISGTWTQIASDIDGEGANDRSGYSVNLSSDGSTLAIGAFRNDGNGSDSGHVRVYNINEFQTNRDGTIDSPFTIKSGEKYIINHEITLNSRLTVNSSGTLIVSESGNIIFTGSGNLINNGTIINNSHQFVYNSNTSGTASITGDPYIKSANGKITKTPNRHGFYRLFENADIFINCQVDELNISKSLDAFIDSFKSIANGKHASKLVNTACNIARSGYWNKSIYIRSEGNSITYNLFDNHISQQKEIIHNYFNVFIDKESKKNTIKCINVNDIITETINISWNHSKHGMQIVTLDQYKNPQVQNGITFKSTLVHDKASTGLFVKNYKAKYMSLNSLSEGKCKRITKQLQKKLDTGESVFHEKSIKGKYEQWYTFKNNMVIKS
jgi:hypothetical protein